MPRAVGMWWSGDQHVGSSHGQLNACTRCLATAQSSISASWQHLDGSDSKHAGSPANSNATNAHAARTRSPAGAYTEREIQCFARRFCSLVVFAWRWPSGHSTLFAHQRCRSIQLPAAGGPDPLTHTAPRPSSWPQWHSPRRQHQHGICPRSPVTCCSNPIPPGRQLGGASRPYSSWSSERRSRRSGK